MSAPIPGDHVSVKIIAELKAEAARLRTALFNLSVACRAALNATDSKTNHIHYLRKMLAEADAALGVKL